MGRLIFEFEKRRKVQETEAKFCYVFKNLKENENENTKHPDYLTYYNSKGELLVEKTQHNIYFHVTFMWNIFKDKYGEYMIESIIKNLLKTHFGIEHLRVSAFIPF